jgi:5-hydroxyisourate hydrolase-like protein (transthyretin family)
VYDIATAKPIAGAHVIVNRPDAKGESRLADAKSDAQGRFQIEKISPGICTVDVSADGYAARRAAYEHLGPDTLKRLTVELAMATDVEGTVIDADEGKPVAAVEVRLDSPMAIDGRGYRSPAQPRAITDAAGRFKIVGVPAGYAQLWCVASGYYHNSLAKLYKFPGEAVKLELVGTGTVKIQVFDAKRQPIKENYIVEIEPEGGGGVGTWGGSSQVGPDGTVTFDGVPPGKYRISGRPNPGSVNDNSPNYWIKVVRRKTVNVEVVHGKY